MRTKFLFFALFSVFALSISAQSDSYQNYVDKAMSSLENGDCVSANKWYNVYKELTGKTMSSVELLIQDCKSGSSSDSAKVKYVINDKIKIGDYLYRVAHIEDDGAHGLAVYDFGSGPISDDMIKKRTLPTRSEMLLIAKNADKLGLARDIYYWTLDRASSSQNYYMKMSGSTDYTLITSSKAILLVYRF